MSDYLRQLQNDEKRCPCAVIATISGDDIVGPLADPALAVSTIPAQSALGRVYAIVTEPFAAGSTLDWGFVGLPVDFLDDLDLATVGATRSQKPHGGIFTTDSISYIVPNANAIGSTTGEVKLVIELTEADLKSGKYSI